MHFFFNFDIIQKIIMEVVKMIDPKYLSNLIYV